MVSVLCSPGYEEVDEQWFSPEFWGESAVSVSVGGRGSAWFVHSPGGDLVLRHYRRGGMVARFSERAYLFTGLERTRSFSEFKLLSRLWEKGLPVPKPVAAMVSRNSPWSYTAAILIGRIAGAQPLPEHPAINEESLWRRVGQTIARFHREGLDHVDLNCDNILVTSEHIHLIDFDRCRLREGAAMSGGWARRNLKRLRRSVEKRCLDMPEDRREVLWAQLLAGYQGIENGGIGKVLRSQ